MTKLRFADTVDALCKRPAAYTLHGTLPEVLAYLDGLGKGLRLQPGSHWGMSGFFAWLSKKLGLDTMRGDELLLTFGDEKSALREFARLYREYAQLEADADEQKESHRSLERPEPEQITMTKLEFSKNVTAICKRPRMYTLHGTLPEIIASLDGLGKGVGLQPGSDSGMSRFFVWLARKLGKDEGTAWDQLLLTFGDEEAALHAFTASMQNFKLPLSRKSVGTFGVLNHFARIRFQVLQLSVRRHSHSPVLDEQNKFRFLTCASGRHDNHAKPWRKLNRPPPTFRNDCHFWTLKK